MDVLIELGLHLFGLLLKEEYLVLVINLCLRQTLATLITHIIKSLLKPNLLRIVEFLQIGQLPLRSLINLINGVLQLTLLVLQLLLQILNLLLQPLLSLVHLLLMLCVLLLTQGKVLVTVFFGSLKRLSKILNLFLEVFNG